MKTIAKTIAIATITFGCMVAGVSVVPAGAQSTVFNFQHSGATDFFPFLTRAQDGFSLDIHPFTSTDPNGTVSPAWSAVVGTGLGVYTGTSGLGVQAYSGDSNDLDGSNLDGSSTQMEGLRFTFNTGVKLEAIHFAGMGSSDDFNLTVDGTLKLLDVSPNPLDLAEMRDSWYSVNQTGTEFLIWADGIDDDFRVAGLQAAAIPEPTSLVLMVTALTMAGTVRRLRIQ